MRKLNNFRSNPEVGELDSCCEPLLSTIAEHIAGSEAFEKGIVDEAGQARLHFFFVSFTMFYYSLVES